MNLPSIKGPVRPRQPPNPTKTYLLQALNGQDAIVEFTAAVAALSTLILAVGGCSIYRFGCSGWHSVEFRCGGCGPHGGAARTAGSRAAIMAEVLQCHVFARPDFANGRTAWPRRPHGTPVRLGTGGRRLAERRFTVGGSGKSMARCHRTVLAYWKFESISLQRRVRCELNLGKGGLPMRLTADGINSTVFLI